MSDYVSMKVVELKEMLKSRGLGVTGTKPELIARLEENDRQNEAAQVEEPSVEKVQEDKKTSEPVIPATDNSEQIEQVATSNNTEKPAESSTNEEKGDETERVIKELEKRAARAKRFGIENDESEATIRRIKKFGLSAVGDILKPLESKVSKNSKSAKSNSSSSSKPSSIAIDEETLKKRRAKFGLAN